MPLHVCRCFLCEEPARRHILFTEVLSWHVQLTAHVRLILLRACLAHMGSIESRPLEKVAFLRMFLTVILLHKALELEHSLEQGLLFISFSMDCIYILLNCI